VGVAVGGIFAIGAREALRAGPKTKRRLSYKLDKGLAQSLKAHTPTAEYARKAPGVHKGGMLYVTRIALTGGPCAGKSSSMDSLREMLTQQGYDVYFAPEVPTVMMNGGCKYPGIDGGEALMQFEMGLINLQLQLERTFTQVATSTGRPSVVIMDRGLLDIKAYLPEDLWAELLKRLNLTESYLLGRYDLVLHLKTAAHGAEKFYTLTQAEGSGVRSETAEQARALDDKMVSCWGRHPNHAIIGNTEYKDFKGKLEATNEHVMRTVRALTRADLAMSFLRKQVSGKSCEETFAIFDKDKNNSIEASELLEAVSTYGLEISLEEAQRLINELTGKPAGEGGALGLEEFRKAVMLLLEESAMEE